MTEIERIQQYIKRTKITHGTNYDMHIKEMYAFYDLIHKDIFEAMSLTFSYGQAKGYRMAKREEQKN